MRVSAFYPTKYLEWIKRSKNEEVQGKSNLSSFGVLPKVCEMAGRDSDLVWSDEICYDEI